LLCHHTGVRVSEFDFELPDHLIAQHPRPRGESRLLVVDRNAGRWEESRVADLPARLRSGDLLVVNDSRVFPARLLGRRLPGGGHAECLLLEGTGVISTGSHQLERPCGNQTRPPFVQNLATGSAFWSLVSPGAKLQPGARIDFSDQERAPGISLTGQVLEIDPAGRRLVRLTADGASVSDAVDKLGHIPLPPYIRRPDTDLDRLRYQTIFARETGSIAAPTAGLHFDHTIVRALEAAGVRKTAVTLHVGYGTFKPVKVDDTADHRVDAERWEVTPDAAGAIASAKAAGGRLVAVGTTTTRALESAARGTGAVVAGRGATDLCITPGYEFRAIDGLLTNFHLPRSSLLMLVAAFAGRDLVLAAYRDAVAREFAFYSYGDAMLIL
jgi:S-adenosylmethionine:tRNA ribosyltransferase-isomerase